MLLLRPVQGRRARRSIAAIAALLLACLPAAAGPVRAAASIDVEATASEQVHVGDTVHYTFTVANAGDVDLHDVVVTDDHCTPTVLVSNGDGDALLEPPELWTYACDLVVVEGEGPPNPIVNLVTATASTELGATVSDTDSFAVHVLHPAFQFDASAWGSYVGDTVRYFFTVANIGDTPLSGITVTAAACSSAIAGPTDDEGADLILSGDMEVWGYSCDGPVIGPGDTRFEVNATVNGHDSIGLDIEASTRAATQVIHPSATLSPGANPTTAHVGDTITFTLKLTNTGDSEMHSTLFSGTECDAGTVKVINLDDNGGVSPGEVWTFTCSHKVTEKAGATVHNVFTFKSSDGGDRLIELSATVNVAIVALGATAPPSVAPSDSAMPASLEPSAGSSLAPGASATTPPTGFSPAPTAAPVPTGGGDSGGALPLILALGLVILAVAGGGWFAWQRRRGTSASIGGPPA